MNKENKKYVVTYIGITEIPKERRKRLGFYTQTQESQKEGIHFFRFTNASSKEQKINELLQMDKILKLPNPIPIEQGQMIWLNEKGKVLLGENSEGIQEMAELFDYNDLLKARE